MIALLARSMMITLPRLLSKYDICLKCNDPGKPNTPYLWGVMNDRLMNGTPHCMGGVVDSYKTIVIPEKFQ